MSTILFLLRLGGLRLIMTACRFIVGPELRDEPLPRHVEGERRMTHGLDCRRRFAGRPMAGPLQ